MIVIKSAVCHWSRTNFHLSYNHINCLLRFSSALKLMSFFFPFFFKLSFRCRLILIATSCRPINLLNKIVGMHAIQNCARIPLPVSRVGLCYFHIGVLPTCGYTVNPVYRDPCKLFIGIVLYSYEGCPYTDNYTYESAFCRYRDWSLGGFTKPAYLCSNYDIP